MAKALTLILLAASGSAAIAPRVPPAAGGDPRNGEAWISMMMIPIPDMSPDTTT